MYTIGTITVQFLLHGGCILPLVYFFHRLKRYLTLKKSRIRKAIADIVNTCIENYNEVLRKKNRYETVFDLNIDFQKVVK